jgi:hypothetical protein
MSLLTKPQRLLLAGLARRAWKQRSDANATDLTYDQYRHEEAIRACGHKISEAPRTAFDDLFTHFQKECGNIDRAFDHALKSEHAPNDWRGWQLQILTELKKAELPWNYAQPIAQKKYGQSLENLSPDQLKTVFFDIRRAVKSRLQKAAPPLSHV